MSPLRDVIIVTLVNWQQKDKKVKETQAGREKKSIA